MRWKGGDPQEKTATIGAEGLRDRLWQIGTERLPDYAKWQSETDRQLRLVLLDAAP